MKPQNPDRKAKRDLLRDSPGPPPPGYFFSPPQRPKNMTRANPYRQGAIPSAAPGKFGKGGGDPTA